MDGRSGEVTWSTITDFEGSAANAADNVNIWGWQEGTSQLLLTEDSAGADGFAGLTLHYDLDNDGSIDTSVTFTGLSNQADLNIGASEVNNEGYLLVA